jgi:flagellar capping protein FliD
MSTIFNGNSRYSLDFQSVIDRAVAIASLPKSQLDSHKTQLGKESEALGLLNTKFSALQTAIGALNNAMGSGSLGATVTDPDVATATVGTGALEGTYSIEVTDPGAFTTSMTSDLGPKMVSNPATGSLSKLASPSFTLTAGAGSYSITPAANNLSSLVDAINAKTEAHVHATAVNVGTAVAPDYRLSLTSTDAGDRAIQLNDGSMNLLTEQSRGDDQGAFTTTRSSVPGPHVVTDPTTQSLSNRSTAAFTLSVGSHTYTVVPGKNTLSGLVDAINADTTFGARATMVNVGSNAAPDYRLSLKASKLGDFAVQLSDGVIDLQTEQVRGTLATYKVNGSTHEAVSDTRSVTIAPGLTVNLQGQSEAGAATSITLMRESGPLADALGSLVAAYNGAVDELDKHHGTADGSLAGQNIVFNLSRALQKVTNYYGTGSGTNSLAALGIDLDQTGHMSLKEMVLLGANFGDSEGVSAFLGDAVKGGFIKNATAALREVEDAVSGTLTSAMAAVKAESAGTDDRIAEQQVRVEALRIDLQAKMAATDALIASMEQQYSYLSQMFQSMQDSNSSY